MRMGPGAAAFSKRIFVPLKTVKMEKTAKQLQKLLATTDYRPLPPVQRAQKLMSEENVSQKLAARLCRVNRSTLQRAIKAGKDGRKAGQVGRPHLLEEEMESALKKKIEEKIDKNENVTYRTFKNLVILSIESLNCILHSRH